MKLATSKTKITQNMQVSGLLSGKMEFDISKGTSDVEWVGPKIPPALWNQVLAFFKKTFESTKSECQVRLYVNTRLGTWAAWAYPQKARSNMAAEEIADHADVPRQREQFKSSEGWIYLGTVHHHCDITAFQSSTDRHNEESQDGLHITVGKMNEAKYDIHARFYIGGSEFVPDMSAFWEIGETAKQMVPPYCYDIVARHQMTTPAPPDTQYPEIWNSNLVEIKPVFFQGGVAGSVSVPTGPVEANPDNWAPEGRRKEMALAKVKSAAKEQNVTEAEMDTVFAQLESDAIVGIIRKAAIQYRLHIHDIVHEWGWEQDMKKNDPDWRVG